MFSQQSKKENKEVNKENKFIFLEFYDFATENILLEELYIKKINYNLNDIL